MIFLFVGYPIILDSCILDGWLLCYDQTELIPFSYSVIGTQIVYVEYLHRNWYSKFRTKSAAPSHWCLSYWCQPHSFSKISASFDFSFHGLSNDIGSMYFARLVVVLC